MRIVTRPDFDGVVCAVLLCEAENVSEPVKWVEPNDMQKGRVVIKRGDIIANLPFDSRCSLWFDHHYTNRPDVPFKGAYAIAPSAAGIVFVYYQKRFRRDYRELVRAADRIDAAELTRDEVEHPENNDYVLLSMTVSGREKADEPYWNLLVDLLRRSDIETIMVDPEVSRRCRAVVQQNARYREHLLNHTTLQGHVAVTDFRCFEKAPTGNRFLCYSLFPDSAVSVKIRYDHRDRNRIVVSVGHSIFNPLCRVNAGLMLKNFGGGGHHGAGGCSFDAKKADDYIPRIIEILVKNEPNEP